MTQQKGEYYESRKQKIVGLCSNYVPQIQSQQNASTTRGTVGKNREGGN